MSMQPRHPLLAQVTMLWSAGRHAEAILILNQLAADDNAEALFTLAEMRWVGRGMPQDTGQGRELLRRAGEAGLAQASLYFTNLLANGVAGRRDWPAALKRLDLEARGDPRRRAVRELIGRMALDAEGDPLSPPKGERLSTSPDVILFPQLFSAAECAYFLSAAESGYQPSMVNDAGGRQVRDPIRTSDASALHWLIEDPAIHAFNRRLAAASGTAFDQGEATQILRYRPGQEYRPHFDFVRATENSRIMTALVYLNHDYQGGETCFLKTGLEVKGRQGDALVFRSMGADGGVDPMSEHAGLPVTGGTKFIASRWIREKKWIP